MFESWFDQINAFLFTHPHALAKLIFLWRVKSWLLTALMLFFLYLIYKDQKEQQPRGKPAARRKKTGTDYFAA
jgi:hypothetical protein